MSKKKTKPKCLSASPELLAVIGELARQRRKVKKAIKKQEKLLYTKDSK
jgi:hypothetical protein